MQMGSCSFFLDTSAPLGEAKKQMSGGLGKKGKTVVIPSSMVQY